MRLTIGKEGNINEVETLKRMYNEVSFAIERGYPIDTCDFSNRIISEKSADFVSVLRALSVEAIKNFYIRFSRGNIDSELFMKNIVVCRTILGILDA